MKGSFVVSNQNSLGIGKIVDADEGGVTVEYFFSISKRVEKKVPATSITPTLLQNQTRCYLWSDETKSWWAGRIGSRDASDRTYEVSFPNNYARYIPETDIYVRCRTPVQDPTETLALRSHETPYFHDRRRAFVNCIISQRATSFGMTGLLSSNIKLYPHQTEVVRRVLADPVQRYLLADEVGLGKTIEAGAILRQYLLDEGKKSALVIVPTTLVEQWNSELEDKFKVSDFDGRVDVISLDSVSRDLLGDADGLGFLIIDEAHHIAAGAGFPTGSHERERFEICKQLAHHVKRLLLLSATPVLHNENSFLSMLHLLDPATYKLEDLDAFRDRVNRRQDIGRVLLSFRENSAVFVIKTTINRLQTVFPNDKVLNSLLDQLRLELDSSVPKPLEQRRLIRAIRIHVSETYRLHRRMLRNRRESVKLPPRLDAGRAASDLKEEYDDDERGLIVNDLIDDWRTYAIQATGGVLVEGAEGDSSAKSLHNIFTILVRASGSWLGVLEKVLLVRLLQAPASTIDKDFNKQECEILTRTPLFNGETELLQRMLEVVQQPGRNPDRIQLLTEMLRRIKTSGAKAVVFTNFESAQQEIVQSLRSAYGVDAVSSHDSRRHRTDVDNDLRRFHETANCFVLVSDPSGEEGLNLQFADWIIHFDLPWSPNRLEQRIGRVDRIGRNQSVKTRTLIGAEGEETFQDAWYQLLRDGFGIFRKSVAGLQFYIDSKMPSLEQTLFSGGAASLLHIVPDIQSEIESEELKIDEQNALDEIDTFDGKSKGYLDQLQKYDTQCEKIQKAYDGWIIDVLRFKRHHQDTNPHLVAYKSSEHALVPFDVLTNQFAHVIGVTGTYSRETAIEYPSSQLFRVGEPMTEALIRYLQVDDRGQAFAMWRQYNDWDPDESADWVGFRFDYVVETDLRAVRQILQNWNLPNTSLKAIARRSDSLFPPFTHTNFLDLNFQEVAGDELLKILSLPYRKEGTSRCDYNLNFQRLSAISQMVDPQQWASLCQNARARSEEALRASDRFQNFCRHYAINTKRELSKRNDQLRLRIQRENELGISNHTLSDEIRLEDELQAALIRGVMKPQLRLDAIGFIVVSGRPPVN